MTAPVIVTGFAPQGRIAYGARALATFDQFWPREISQLCYIEENAFSPCGRAQLIHVDCCRGLREFLKRHAGNKQYNGEEANEKWKVRDRLKAEFRASRGDPKPNFRFEALRFSRQLFAPEHAAQMVADGRVLVWLDGDVISTAPVRPDMIERLIGDHDVAYLGRRAPAHSEIGFWAIRLGPLTREFLTALADQYRTDQIFELAEWHSAFVWDRVREKFEARGLRCRSLTNYLHRDAKQHPWFSVPLLAGCTDHLKGRRKAVGVSPESLRR